MACLMIAKWYWSAVVLLLGRMNTRLTDVSLQYAVNINN